jgi:hypothetical protein
MAVAVLSLSRAAMGSFSFRFHALAVVPFRTPSCGIYHIAAAIYIKGVQGAAPKNKAGDPRGK